MELTNQEIELFKSALGLHYSNKPFRNYYNIWKFDTPHEIYDIWMELMRRGLAIKRTKESPYRLPSSQQPFQSVYFHITERGFDLVLKYSNIFDLDPNLNKLTSEEIFKLYEL